MPNGRTHKVVGAIAGGSFALVRSAGQPAVHRTVETAGGVLAGVGLGMLPDVLEPAIHPGHRSVAHGVVPAVALGVPASRHLDSWQAYLRASADRQGALAMQSQSTLARLWHAFLELLLRLAAGALAGALAGYGSHLVLDAFTPRSLPLIA